jgi:hypothetical protein
MKSSLGTSMSEELNIFFAVLATLNRMKLLDPLSVVNMSKYHPELGGLFVKETTWL